MKSTKTAVVDYKRYLIVPRAGKFFIYSPTNRPCIVVATKEQAKQWVDTKTKYSEGAA